MDFHQFASQPDQKLDLLTGALLVAQDAYPGLSHERYRRRLDDLAAPLLTAGLERASAEAQAAALAEHLYERLGFRGNDKNFYDPRNSFINQVLERRLGIPISLALVYTEVAQRVGVPAQGVSFPGHFLVRIDAGEMPPVIVDPFFRGATVGREVLDEMLKRSNAALDADRMLTPASVRSVVFRMLMNLRGIYATRGEYSRLLLVLDRMLELAPDSSTDQLRERGLVWAKLGAPEAAVDDLTRYVRLAPSAGDVAEVRRLIDRLQRAETSAAN